MSSKVRSLRFKLTIVYIASILAVVSGVVYFIEYNNQERAVFQAVRESEIGPGYLSSTLPQNLDPGILSIPEYLTSQDIENNLADYEPFVDSSIAGGVGWSTSVEGPVSIDNRDYFKIVFKITEMRTGRYFEVGPIMIPQSHFPRTIDAFSNPGDRFNDMYFRPVPGFADVLVVVSMDKFNFPIVRWQEQVAVGLIQAFPVVLFSAIILGVLMSWMTVNPIRRITRATESLSRSDLSQRVVVKSKDEIGQLSQSFNVMADRLEEAFNQQKTFVSDAAHELRTPLASLKASITKALSADRSNEEYRQLLSFILLRTDTLEELINDLLFLARADEGRLKIGEEIFDLSPVLLETADSFKYLFDERGISFSSLVSRGYGSRVTPNSTCG